MNVYLVYREKNSQNSLLNDLTEKFGEKECFPIAEHLVFVKTDDTLTDVMKAAGFTPESKSTGFAVEANNINGWYNVDLWDWRNK